MPAATSAAAVWPRAKPRSQSKLEGIELRAWGVHVTLRGYHPTYYGGHRAARLVRTCYVIITPTYFGVTMECYVGHRAARLVGGRYLHVTWLSPLSALEGIELLGTSRPLLCLCLRWRPLLRRSYYDCPYDGDPYYSMLRRAW